MITQVLTPPLYEAARGRRLHMKVTSEKNRINQFRDIDRVEESS